MGLICGEPNPQLHYNRVGKVVVDDILDGSDSCRINKVVKIILLLRSSKEKL